MLANNKEVFDDIIKDCDTFLFDCDGVIWQHDEAVAGAVKVVNKLHDLGKKILYITNNSTKTRDQYMEKLTRFGFVAHKDHVFSTAYTSALYLKNIAKISGKVYLVGNKCIAEELQSLGIECFGDGPDIEITDHSVDKIMKCHLEEGVEAVLVGFDGYLSYTKLLKAATYLLDPKCLFVATNDDRRFPFGGRKCVIPGTGCIIQAVAVSAQRQPDVWAGKPEKFMFQCIQNAMNIDASRSLMIGDTMSVDIAFGSRNNLKTLLVFTGSASEETMNDAIKSTDETVKEQVPDYYMPSLGDWVDFL